MQSNTAMPAIYQSTTPQVMGILNITPDSFSDGAKYLDTQSALNHAQHMVNAGASIIDIGGESTRPGAAEVTVEEELARVIKLIKPIKSLGVSVSVDTSKPEVMLAAAEAGADMLNDVRALSQPGALDAAAQAQLPVCLMHMQGQPANMQLSPNYYDVISEVSQFFESRLKACEKAGIARELISIDPGFGFGKSLPHNIQLLRELKSFKQFKLPILVGMSRKSMLGEITGKPLEQRTAASLAVALVALQNGANIIRVHDVAETRDIIKVYQALSNC
ncbi:dihydropteroate synthase [Aliikangiella sp. IMCC44653]